MWSRCSVPTDEKVGKRIAPRECFCDRYRRRLHRHGELLLHHGMDAI